MKPDITPTIQFDLLPSVEELIRPVDDEQIARVWRELALMLASQLHAQMEREGRLQEQQRETRDLLQECLSRGTKGKEYDDWVRSIS